MKSGARAVADVEQGRILASVEIAAPAERVFLALTTDAEIPEQAGAVERALLVAGDLRDADSPRRLVRTRKAETVTYRVEPIDGGTRLTLRHEGLVDHAASCRAQAERWERALGWLAKHVGQTEELPYFLCRLLPPRPSFMADMTAEEMDIMRRHAGYWKGLLDGGFAVVFGPVKDPQGGWGLGVLRAPSEEKLRELQDADPAIRANRGFRYETLPMLRAVTRS